MTSSYFGRLFLLSSACFFLVQLVVGSLIALLAPAAVRRAGTMNPARAARFLLTLRLLPAGFSIAVVGLLCVPSYVRFEPRSGEEEVGFACLSAALLGALLAALAISRTVRAMLRTSRFLRECGGLETRIEGETVWVVHQSGGLALAGVLHPRLLISEDAMGRLSRDQLAAAMRHERAHGASRDNLKRLLILLAPSLFPAFRLLEQAWSKCAEWAADDQAAQGGADRSAALAEALVRVARLQTAVQMPPLVTSLVEAGEDLSLRVDRLLLASPADASGRHWGAIAMGGAALAVFSIGVSPGSLRVVHYLLERLLD